MQKQTIFIGNNSIMSSLLIFIINGIYLIVINQILVSHDIYYGSDKTYGLDPGDQSIFV